MAQVNTKTETETAPNLKYFGTKKAAMAYKVATGFPLIDNGSNAEKGERWAVEILTEHSPRLNTKAATVRNIVQKMQGKERKDILPVIMEQTGLGKQAASTYYYNAKQTLHVD